MPERGRSGDLSLNHSQTLNVESQPSSIPNHTSVPTFVLAYSIHPSLCILNTIMNTQITHAINQLLPSIIALAHPERVILFGSAAADKTGPDSDLDFLIIIPDGKKPAVVTNRLNMQIRNKLMPCDFIVTTPASIRKNQTKPGGIYQTALAEGKELYAVR